jgi:hypothetical protein
MKALSPKKTRSIISKRNYLIIGTLILLYQTSNNLFAQSIMISQYIETNSGSTPKGIEIYNISGANITFSSSNNLRVFQGTNGGSCGSIVNITSGTLTAGQVWVIGTSDLTSFANSNGANLSGTTTFTFAFNGDDALQLYLGSSLQDVIGTCGSDPGSSWSGNGVSTANQNIQTSTGICTGTTSYWTNPSLRFELVADGSTMTGFGDAPTGCAACTAPSTQASAISFSAVDQNTMSLTWTNGDGAGRVVVMNTSNSFTTPSNGSDPAASTIYSSGQQVIYNGSGNTVSVSGLNSSTTYWFRIYEFCNPDRNYNTATSAANPANQATIAPSPLLSANSLTAFGSQCIGSSYGPNSFTITGTTLTSANVTVAALSGYSFSINSIGPFTSSLSMNQPGGSFSTIIYVQFNPIASVNYDGYFTVAGGGAPAITVAASGQGINTTATSTTGASSAITSNAADLAGTISSLGCSNASAYGIEYSTTSGFVNGSGTSVSSSNLVSGNYNSSLSGLNPNTTYYYTSFVTNNGGTTYGSEQSFTTLDLEAPIANAGSTVGDFSFVANWDPVFGASSYELDVSTTPFSSGNADELFISEYVEGSGNNKYIEIFNGTGASVNLSDYRLRLFANGSSSAANDVLLSGSLANNATIVYRNTSASAFGGTSTVNAAVNFNGDDAVALYKISTSSYVDIFGRIGNDPGSQWSLGGNSTADQTLIRNSDIHTGVNVNPTGTGTTAFTTLSTEWTQYASDYVSNLGSHTFISDGATYVPGYQNLSVSGISQTVSGLNSNTTYYYRVRAVTASSTSINSNIITVLTSNLSCASALDVSGFSPTNGPIGTRVTISGSNFSNATSVTFNGVSATYFDIISASEIIAQVPEEGSTGPIRVADNLGCYDNSASNFTLLSLSGNCLGIMSDIIISEAYDPASGNNHYIEIYNGTAASIDLNGSDDYSLRLLNKSSASDASPTVYNLDISGLIDMSSTAIYYAGSNGGLSTIPAQGFNNGFNEYDEIQLLKNGTIIDKVQFPNNVGYDYRRKNTVTGPNVAYFTTEWNRIETGETTSDIGIFSVSSNFSISTEPIDASAEPCGSFSLNVTSTYPSVSYQWYTLNSLGNWVSIGPTLGLSGYNTSNLSINPALGFDKAQFYCEISQAICQKRTNAVQFDEIPNSRRYFRSAGSGNWNGTGIWEYASSPAGPYLTACFYPTSSSSDEIAIESGHTITVLGQDIEIDQVTVKTGGTLILNSANAITFTDGLGVDFFIEGTFIDNGNSGAGNGVFMNAGATWEMGINGSLIKTNNSSFTVYRDNYEGGMSLIPSTSSIIIRSVSGSNPSFTAVGNTYYPNLIFESNSGLWNPVSVSSRFNGSSDFPTIKGNLDIGGGGAGQVIIYNQNTNATPITVLGNTIIRSGSVLTNAGSGNGTGFDLKGNLTVDGTLTVTSSGTNEYLSLSGNTTQTIGGNGVFSIQNLRVQNTSAFGIDLQHDFTVINELRMTSGHIQTGTNLLSLGNSIINRGSLSHTAGFVVGKMRRYFNGTNSGHASSKFPMGVLGATYYDRSVNLEYTSAASTPGHLTVEFINSPMASATAGLPIASANTGGATFDVTYLEDEGYWKIDNQTSTLTDGQYTISLTGESFQSVTDISALTLLKRVGIGPWTCPGNHITASGTIAKPIISRTMVSGFSNFGFGSGAANPLPVEFLYFQATQVDAHVNLQWSTGTEINCRSFQLEKSKNAVDFEAFGEIEAAGNSSIQNYYNLVDKSPFTGVSYYRLKQMDFNGGFTYSNIAPVNFKINEELSIEWISINPQNADLTLRLNGKSEAVQFSIFDLSGRIIKQGIGHQDSNYMRISTGVIARGMYFVSIGDNSKKVIKPFVY